ncbi:MAG: hypothetical protein RSC44_05950, partial [Clostridia bacterium]
YATKDFCEKAIRRFKTHVLVGTFSIEEKDGKFNFVLSRKTYNHRGTFHDNVVDAEKHAQDIKKFAQTDIIREQ